MEANLAHVFVYGTLKRGQCREKCWPLPPQRVEAAWTLGQLYDTGPYPALLPGSDRVAGELWIYDASSIGPTLQILDQIEGTNQGAAPNEYDRERVEVTTFRGSQLQAFAYFYAQHASLKHFRRIEPKCEFQGHFYAFWPDSLSSPSLFQFQD